MRFGMETRHFQKLVPSTKLAHSLKFFICHMANIEVLKYVFTRAVTKIKIFDSCHTADLVSQRLSYFYIYF